MKKIIEPKWEPKPISLTCEVGIAEPCGRRATLCYPTWGGGFMSLCEKHSQKHLPHVERISRLVKEGFEVKGKPCNSQPYAPRLTP